MVRLSGMLRNLVSGIFTALVLAACGAANQGLPVSISDYQTRVVETAGAAVPFRATFTIEGAIAPADGCALQFSSVQGTMTGWYGGTVATTATGWHYTLVSNATFTSDDGRYYGRDSETLLNKFTVGQGITILNDHTRFRLRDSAGNTVATVYTGYHYSISATGEITLKSVDLSDCSP